jgi:hypothetical protein
LARAVGANAPRALALLCRLCSARLFERRGTAADDDDGGGVSPPAEGAGGCQAMTGCATELGLTATVRSGT